MYSTVLRVQLLYDACHNFLMIFVASVNEKHYCTQGLNMKNRHARAEREHVNDAETGPGLPYRYYCTVLGMHEGVP
jgi:hypothetical protein